MDNTRGLVQVTIDDPTAGGTHRRKDVWLTSTVTFCPDGGVGSVRPGTWFYPAINHPHGEKRRR